MSIKKRISKTLYIGATITILGLLLSFFYLNIQVVEGKHAGAFSVLSHILKFWLTTPFWLAAKLLDSQIKLDTLYWLSLLTSTILLLLIPSTG